MKKITEKLISVGLIAIMATGLFAGCRGDGTDIEKEHQDQTVIYVQNYDCGYGREYVENTIARFTEAVKDIPYEEGKKGVYFDVIHTKTDATGSYLLNSLSTNNAQIYFTEGLTSAALKASTQVMNIADLVNAKSSDENQVSRFLSETSIMDRMYDDYRAHYTTKDGGVYSVPLFVSGNNFTYDVELAENKGLYIEKGSTDTQIKLTKKKIDQATGESNLQFGPDGLPNTEDDGLPETMDQLMLWYKAVSTKGVYLMSFYGANNYSVDSSFYQYWANFEGKKKTKACWTFDGTEVDDLVASIDASKSWNADGTPNFHDGVSYLPATAINLENGFDVQKQEGRYRAMQIVKFIENNYASFVYPQSLSPSETHTEAQSHYIASKYTAKPTFIFAHGDYWEAEATSVFKSYESQNGGKLDRKFAVLPIPKYNREDVPVYEKNPSTGEYELKNAGKNTTIISSSASTMFVKEGVTGAKLDVIKDFIAFFNSPEQMSHQLPESTVSRPFVYDILDEDKARMSNYCKSLYDYYHNDRTDVVLSSSENDFVMANSDDLHNCYWIFDSKYDSNSNNTVYWSMATFHDHHDVTAEQYFYGFYEKWNANEQSKWKNLLSRIGR